MKRCPQCNDFALYDDNVSTCPLCNTRLVSYRRSGATTTSTTAREPIRPNNISSATDSRPVPPEFERSSGLRYHYRGIITEISSHARLHTPLKKWINAVFRGEPYQFGSTSHETVIRIEEFRNSGVSGRKRDLIYYGDVEGRFNYGDDVTITAKRLGDRYIVTGMYLNETESRVRPGPQIPSGVIAIFSLLLLFAAVYLVLGIISFVTSGALTVLLDKAINVVIVAAVLLWLVRSLFRG